MKISFSRPPNFDKIAQAFPAVLKYNSLIFTYGDVIYNPAAHFIPIWTEMHEEVHSREQLKTGPDHWWEMYLISREFRLEQELMAYRVEWKEFSRRNKERNEVARCLHYLATQLSGPVYGGLLSYAQAKERIQYG